MYVRATQWTIVLHSFQLTAKAGIVAALMCPAYGPLISSQQLVILTRAGSRSTSYTDQI